MRDERGITLMEIIIVISIISIILLIAAFKSTSLLTYKERKELTEFKNDINYARNKAVVESITYTVQTLPNSSSYTIQRGETMPKIIKRHTFQEGFTVSKNNFRGYKIIFNRSGAPSQAGSLELRNSKGQRIEITVTPAVGKVNIKFK